MRSRPALTSPHVQLCSSARSAAQGHCCSRSDCRYRRLRADRTERPFEHHDDGAHTVLDRIDFDDIDELPSDYESDADAHRVHVWQLVG